MLIYKVAGKDAILSAFVAEIQIQLFENAYSVLYKQHLYANGDKNKDNTCSPIRIISEYVLFLNSLAMINKILGLSDRYDNKKSQELRTSIGIDKNKICTIKEIGLRNSMEHIEDRLKELAKKNL